MKYLLMMALSFFAACAAAQGFTFEQAVGDYRDRRWSVAYGRFVHLASSGDPDAARIALFMHRNGPLLYGTYWDASREDVEAWDRLSNRGPGRKDPVFIPGPVRPVPAQSRTADRFTPRDTGRSLR